VAVRELRYRRRPLRWLWIAGGLVAVAIGGIGIVTPGLPSTVFFIIAAGCFARSSPRLEAWLLSLPSVGRLVSDHRAGLGMPRRAKQLAVSMIVLFSGLSCLSFALRDAVVGAVVVALLGLVGVAWVLWRVPTREKVLAGREDEALHGPVS
jgi:uncharacterized membrane protein YbaN (DUF454 family)